VADSWGGFELEDEDEDEDGAGADAGGAAFLFALAAPSPLLERFPPWRAFLFAPRAGAFSAGGALEAFADALAGAPAK
jgi:hypothetical protein